MASITLKGTPFLTVGELPSSGTPAPGFALTKTDLSEVRLADLAGRKVILNIFPSVDTPTCATSVRTFNKRAAAAGDTTVLCLSLDLPFALKRFCGAEGIEDVEAVSAFRDPEFGARYGVTIADGPLKGLLSRAVVVVDSDGKVVWSEQVTEIADEPDYDGALAAAARAS